MSDSQVSRRELLGAVARWSVPTVVTITLGAKVLEAKASCPPCQRKTGPTCRACTVGQMLNCKCEPCLGPPYCSAVGPLMDNPQGSRNVVPGATGSQGGLRGPSGSTYTLDPRSNAYQELMRQRARQQNDPFAQPLYRDPFGVQRSPYGRPQTPQQPGLYDRLRPDSLSRRSP